MAPDAIRDSLMTAVAEKIDAASEKGDAQALHNLADALYGRLPVEDLRWRDMENLYGSLHGMLHHIRHWSGEEASVAVFNPELANDGWSSRYTIVWVLCRGLPFSTASVRSELNRRNLRIHTVSSSDMFVRRDDEGVLQELLFT